MKTRKYKDNQQRKSFAQNESKILLMQYFKKKASSGVIPHSEAKLSNVQPSYANSKEMQPLGQIPSVSDYKKWASFKYPKSLSTFFLERPSLKSTYLLINLKDHVSKKELENTYNRIPNLKKEQALDLIQIAIKDLSFKVCYSKKTKQQQNKTRIRGRCIQSNRPRSVSRLLRLSRIRIRTLALEGKIPGCTRST